MKAGVKMKLFAQGLQEATGGQVPTISDLRPQDRVVQAAGEHASSEAGSERSMTQKRGAS